MAVDETKFLIGFILGVIIFLLYNKIKSMEGEK
jgi:hypothetical protein